MKIKNLFDFRRYIKSLSDDKIDAESLFGVIVMTILTFVLTLYGFGGNGANIIRATLEPLNNITGPERLSVMFNVFVGMIGMALLYLFVYAGLLTLLNALVKWVLKFYNRKIALWKLMNIAFYTLFLNKFLIFILILIMSILTPILKGVSGEDGALFVGSMMIIINIGTFVLYILGVKWTTKNKFIPF